MRDFVISPPFGTFIRHPRCTPVLGTYTLHKRGGWHTKLYRAITTIRSTKSGWLNRIGLQNSGIRSVKDFSSEAIYSVAAVESSEWDELIEHLPSGVRFEINLSCPNLTHKTHIKDEQVAMYLQKFPDVIFKLSPTDDIQDVADRLIRLGAQFLHLTNTLPTPLGGESGTRLKELSLAAVRSVHSRHPSVTIIGGGGIYSLADVASYKEAGASHFSLATAWLYPPRALRLLREFSYLD